MPNYRPPAGGGGGFTPAPSNTLYVDRYRADVYVEDGTNDKPFKTIQAAIDQVVTNADNTQLKPYEIIVGPGTYTENVVCEDALLVSLTIRGAGKGITFFDPAAGNAFQSQALNSNLVILKLIGITFVDPVALTGVNGSNFLALDGTIEGCEIRSAFAPSVAGVLNLKNTNWLSTFTVENISGTFMEDCSGLSHTEFITNFIGNMPAGFAVTTFVINDSVLLGNFTLTDLVFGNVQMGSQVGGAAAVVSLTAGSSLECYNSWIPSATVNIAAGASLTLRNSLISPASVITNLGTLTEENGGPDIRQDGVNLKTDASFLDFRGVTMAASGTGVILNFPPAPPANGYIAGGTNVNTATIPPTTVYRHAFSDDTAAMVTVGVLTNGSCAWGGTNSETAGYFGMGSVVSNSSSNSLAFIQKLLFASDATALTNVNSMDFGGGLGTMYHGATPSQLKGYWAGGRQTGAGAAVTAGKSIEFANDAAAAAVIGVLSAALSNWSACSSINYGYFQNTRTDRLDFANDATAMTTPVAAGGSFSRGSFNSSSFGYWGGGNVFPAALNSLQKIDFGSDTALIALAPTLSTARLYLGGYNSNIYGYFSGGTSGSAGFTVAVTTTQRLDFAADGVAMVTVAALPASRAGSATCQSGGFL